MASTTTDQRLGVNSGQAIKVPCVAASTSNLTLSGEQTIDGVLTSASRVLVTGQTDATENGIYLSDTGAWAREPDWDGVSDVVPGTIVRVVQGTSNYGYWAVTSPTSGSITPGTTSVTVSRVDADGVLREDLANTSDPTNGDALVGVKDEHANAQATTLHLWIKRYKHVLDFIPASQHSYIYDSDGASQDRAVVRAGLNNAFASGYKRLDLGYGTFAIDGTGLTIPNNMVTHIEGDGIDSTLISTNSTTVDTLTVEANHDFLTLKGFRLTRSSASSTNDGLYLADSNHNLVVERVRSDNSRYGFRSRYSTWMQKFIQCRAESCNTGYYFQGLNNVGAGSGTTLYFDQCYANSCGGGFYAEYIDEVLFINPACDNLTSNGIYTWSCKTTKITEAHFEAAQMAAAGRGLVNWGGSAANILTVDGLYATNCAVDTGTSYGILIHDTSTNARVQIGGVFGDTLTGYGFYSITEAGADAGVYTLLNSDPSGFPQANVETLVNGKIIDLSTGTYNQVDIPHNLIVANTAEAKQLRIVDGVTAPGASVGYAYLYVDTADGDLKVVFGDGTVKTIATDT